MNDEEAKEEKARYAIFNCSTKALLKIDPDSLGSGEALQSAPNSKYPFSEMKIGQSFAVSFAELEAGSLQSLRSLACKQARLKLRKFAVIVHKDLQVVEVVRIG